MKRLILIVGVMVALSGCATRFDKPGKTEFIPEAAAWATRITTSGKISDIHTKNVYPRPVTSLDFNRDGLYGDNHIQVYRVRDSVWLKVWQDIEHDDPRWFQHVLYTIDGEQKQVPAEEALRRNDLIYGSPGHVGSIRVDGATAREMCGNNFTCIHSTTVIFEIPKEDFPKLIEETEKSGKNYWTYTLVADDGPHRFTIPLAEMQGLWMVLQREVPELLPKRAP